jgi:hypothetical protein
MRRGNTRLIFHTRSMQAGQPQNAVQALVLGIIGCASRAEQACVGEIALRIRVTQANSAKHTCMQEWRE